MASELHFDSEKSLLTCLVYVSASVDLLDDAALFAILESSRRHNQVSEVTGLLVYKEGNFIQVLEGSPKAVHETMKRIMKDTRHHRVIVLLDETIPERLFGIWSMAFPVVDELTEEGLGKYGYLLSNQPYSQVVRQRVLRILLTYRSMFRLAKS